MPKVGRFLGPPPPFRSARFGGRVRSVWSRPEFGLQFLGTVSRLRAWLSRAVVPSCREFHGVLRRRRQSARRRPCVAYAVSAPCIASFVLRPGLGPLARAGRETGPRRGPGPCLVRRAHSRRWPPPFPLGGSALRTLSASSRVAGAARLAGPVLRRSGRGCVSPFPSGPLVRALAYG